MKILRVIASMDPESGGPCQGIRNTVAALSQLGVANEVVCVDSPESEYIKHDSFKIYALGPATNPWAYSGRLLPWLIENISRFDAVIVHGLWLYPSHAMRKAMSEVARKNSKDIPWFVMPHGMLDPYFQEAPDRKFKALRNKMYWRMIEHKVVESATSLLFTCEEELLLARKPFEPYRPKKEINVGYGIQPPPTFTPEMSTAFFQKAQLDSDQKYLLFLSRIHPKKGVDNLINAYLELLENANQDTNNIPPLVIAGPGLETPFGKEMVTLAAKNEKFKNRIIFPGMLTGDAKWGAFYSCEAFVLPSHQENFGIAVVEALACKKPVLISNKINIWREINRSGGGVIGSDTQAGTFEILNDWLNTSSEEKEDFKLKAYDTYDTYFRIEKNIITLIKTLRPNFVVETTSQKNA